MMRKKTLSLDASGRESCCYRRFCWCWPRCIDSWVVFAGLQDQSVYTQWTWSFFKALAQMILIGFESPPFIEHWITLSRLYLGAVFYSLLIASVQSILQANNIASRRFDERLRNLDEFLRREKLPKADRQPIKDDFIRRHAKCQFYSEAEVVEDVAPHRMQTIRCHRAKELAEKDPLFANGRNAEMLGAMAQVMERTTYYAKEIIFTESSHGDPLYCISSGMVDLYREEVPSPFWILTHGESFGFEQYFCRENFITTRAWTKCVLFEVSASDWICVIQSVPDIHSAWKKASHERLKRSQRLNGRDDDVSEASNLT